VREPAEAEIAAQLDVLGHPGETAVWQAALERSRREWRA
jgi:hypothetical protein